MIDFSCEVGQTRCLFFLLSSARHQSPGQSCCIARTNGYSLPTWSATPAAHLVRHLLVIMTAFVEKQEPAHLHKMQLGPWTENKKLPTGPPAGKSSPVPPSADLPPTPAAPIEHVLDAPPAPPSGIHPAPALAPVFTDHMVLQRDLPLLFWGTAPAGGQVTVSLGASRVAGLAEASGKWSLTLPARPASAEPQSATVSLTGGGAVTLSDVLIGDVWLCGGQSNMEFRCNQEATWSAEKSSAALPGLRLLNMTCAGQGHPVSPYPASILARQTPDTFFDPAATWTASTAVTVAPFSAVAWFFGREIHQSFGVPVGLIHCSVGGSPAEAWIRREALAASPQFAPMVTGNWLANPAFEPWCQTRARAQLGTTPGPSSDLGPHHSFQPSFLWSAGPARLAPFPLRGVLWYQGESNALSHLSEPATPDPAWRVKQHEALLPLLIADWRAQWARPDLPFLITQLSSIRETAYASHFWPDFRDQQRRLAASLTHTALAVTSDLGHPTNVHPTNKHDVAHRLAAAARRTVYGQTDVLTCPQPATATRSGPIVTLTLTCPGPALTTSDALPPAAFELAGPDGQFHPATATLHGPTITLTSPAVPTPEKIRHAWQPFSLGNVVNSARLPLTTFQVDVAP